MLRTAAPLVLLAALLLAPPAAALGACATEDICAGAREGPCTLAVTGVACVEEAVCAGDLATGASCVVDAWDAAGVGLFRCQDEPGHWLRVGDLVTTKCAVPIE